MANQALSEDRASAVLSLASLAPAVPIEDGIAVLARMPPEDAAELFRRHKVRLLIDRRKAELKSHGLVPFLAAFEAIVEPARLRLALLPEVVAELADTARSSDVAVWGIKGLAARELYEDPAVRDFGDWDVHIDDVDGAWRFARQLMTQGFDLDPRELPWIKLSSSGRHYGQIRLERAQAAHVFVDIHFGGYSVRHCGLIPVTGGGDPGWHVLGGGENLLLGVANAAGDDFVTIKDLNDLYVAATVSASDWEQLVVRAAAVQLDGFLAVMLRRLLQFATLPDADVDKLEILLRRRNELTPPLHAPSPWMRRVVTVAHAYRTGRIVSRRRAVKAALSAARYYAGRLRLRPRPRLLRHPRRTAFPSLSQATCVRFVPPDLAAAAFGANRPRVVARTQQRWALSPSGEVACHRTAEGDLLEAAGRIFVPTVYYALDDRLTSAALSLSRTERRPET